MTQKDKLAFLRAKDTASRAERKDRRDWKDYKSIQPVSKRSAANGAKSARANREDRNWKCGMRHFIEVGTAVGREINGRIYGIHSIEISSGRTWVRRGVK